MEDAEPSRSAGLYLARGFLPNDLCARLRDAATEARLGQARVFRGATELVDERTRRSKGILLPDRLLEVLEERFAEERPAIARHFGCALSERKPVQLLSYDRGSFFRPHQDNSGEPSLPADVRDRLVSVIVLLSRQTRRPEPDSCCGGELRFFRLPGSDPAAPVRTDITGEEGLLIAFPATGTIHEVRPVTHGRRFSLVTWFARATEPEPARG